MFKFSNRCYLREWMKLRLICACLIVIISLKLILLKLNTNFAIFSLLNHVSPLKNFLQFNWEVFYFSHLKGVNKNIQSKFANQIPTFSLYFLFFFYCLYFYLKTGFEFEKRIYKMLKIWKKTKKYFLLEKKIRGKRIKVQ